MSHDADNRRDHYRVCYAEAERPTLFHGALRCPVLDCSESGVRFRPAPAWSCAAGDRIEGVIRFRRGMEVLVAGTVVRLTGTSAAIVLEPPGIPFRLIMDEQRWQRSRHWT